VRRASVNRSANIELRTNTTTMLRPTRTIAVALLAAAPAMAGMVDLPSTERGIGSMSGAPSQCDSYGLGQFLMDANNTLTTDRTATPKFHGYNDAFTGYSSDNTDGVGLLLNGPGNAKFAADRLVAVTVLQLIGFHDNRYQNEIPSPPLSEPFFEPLLTAEHSIEFPDHAHQGNPGKNEPSTQDRDPVVPEPTGAAMMLLGAIVLARRTRWNREKDQSPNQSPT
jgi:hypothetical protein